MKPARIDALGRLRIPSKFFNKMGIEPGQEIELTIEYGKICIRKFKAENIQERPYVGLVRKLDSLYRACIPVEYLRTVEIERNQVIGLTEENQTILLNKI